MENEQRIWNRSELEQMPEWKEDKQKDWLHIEKRIWITEKFLGKPIEALKEMNYPVFDEMIAKTETTTKEKLKELTKGKTSSFVEETKERLDKREGITLRNGTVLKVGKKYRLDDWDNLAYAIILAFGQEKMIIKFFFNSLDDEELETIELDWKPYTEPKEEPKPKTLEGYQKWYGHDKLKKEISILFSPTRPLNQYIDWYTEQEAIELGLKI